MATINDLSFQQHPCGEGFEAQIMFDNGHPLLVVCGPAVYNRDGADTEVRANALDYTSFEMLYANPAQTEFTSADWEGPVTAAQVNARLAEVEAFAVYEGGPSGGTGE